MYRNINDGQFSIYDFILPFGDHLKEDNRRVQLRNMIDWQMIDEEYSRHFRNKAGGQEAFLQVGPLCPPGAVKISGQSFFSWD